MVFDVERIHNVMYVLINGYSHNEDRHHKSVPRISPGQSPYLYMIYSEYDKDPELKIRYELIDRQIGMNIVLCSKSHTYIHLYTSTHTHIYISIVLL